MNSVGPLLITFSFFAVLSVVGIFLQRSERKRRKMFESKRREMLEAIRVGGVASVDINSPIQVRYWADELGVTEQVLRDAAREIGYSIRALREALAGAKRHP